MKKVIFVALLLALASAAQAGTQDVPGADWISQASWNVNATGNPNFDTFDNGDAIPDVVPGFPWNPAQTPNANGTYGGSFTFDDATGEVTGGSFTTSGGVISNIVQGTWWQYEYGPTTWDFDAGTTTHDSYTCADGIGSPSLCAMAGGPAGMFALTIGAGTDGDGMARFAAFYDPATMTLELFTEGFDGTSGTDYLNSFQIVPVPAAVWLFGSALGLLGWVRRRSV